MKADFSTSLQAHLDLLQGVGWTTLGAMLLSVSVVLSTASQALSLTGKQRNSISDSCIVQQVEGSNSLKATPQTSKHFVLGSINTLN